MSDEPVLVAEDEAMLRVHRGGDAGGCGLSVFEAGDGVEALALLKSQSRNRSCWCPTSRCRAWTAMPWRRPGWP